MWKLLLPCVSRQTTRWTWGISWWILYDDFTLSPPLLSLWCASFSSAAASGSIYTTDERLILTPWAQRRPPPILRHAKIYSLSCDSLKWAARLLALLLYQCYVENIYVSHLVVGGFCGYARKQARRKVPSHCCMLRNINIITGGSDGPLLLWIWDQKGIRDILPLTSKITPITNAMQSAFSQAPSCSTRH